MERASWRDLFEHESPDQHIVQFYDEPGFLRDAVAAWIAPAFRRHGSAVLVCTPEHARLILDRLGQEGFDVPALRVSGRLALVDAREMLAGFMRNGRPDAARFHHLLGGVVSGLRAAVKDPHGEVRAWGEMVNLLWKEGNLPAAQELEAHWNVAIPAQRLHLLCSYQVSNLDPATHMGLLPALAKGHSQLIPQEDYAKLDRAVSLAMADVFGDHEGRHLMALFAARYLGSLGMPRAETVLVGLHGMSPALGQRVLLRARHHYEAGSGSLEARAAGPASAPPHRHQTLGVG